MLLLSILTTIQNGDEFKLFALTDRSWYCPFLSWPKPAPRCSAVVRRLCKRPIWLKWSRRSSICALWPLGMVPTMSQWYRWQMWASASRDRRACKLSWLPILHYRVFVTWKDCCSHMAIGATIAWHAWYSTFSIKMRYAEKSFQFIVNFNQLIVYLFISRLSFFWYSGINCIAASPALWWWTKCI